MTMPQLDIPSYGSVPIFETFFELRHGILFLPDTIFIDLMTLPLSFLGSVGRQQQARLYRV